MSRRLGVGCRIHALLGGTLFQSWARRIPYIDDSYLLRFRLRSWPHKQESLSWSPQAFLEDGWLARERCPRPSAR